MTKLLVSIRQAGEVSIAIDARVDILDVKDPDVGCLGCVDRDTLEDILAATPASQRKSLAMGELADWRKTSFLDWPLPEFQFAKIGLAGMAMARDWRVLWRQWRESLPEKASPVAVAYVDWRRAHAPSIEEVMQWAVESCAPYLLLDTWDKADGSIFDHVALESLRNWSAVLARHSVTLVAAGSLKLHHVPSICACNIRVIGIRGAACDKGRSSSLCPQRLAEWRAAVDQGSPPDKDLAKKRATA